MLFDSEKISQNLLPRQEVRFFLDEPDPQVTEEIKAHLRALAKRWEDYEHPAYGDSYGEYFVNLNRCNFEDRYINRRNALADFVFVELVDGTGKYLDKIEELLEMICSETTWAVPAHSKFQTLREGEWDNTLELYASETASVVAITYYYLKDRLSPRWKERIPQIIEERMFFEALHNSEYPWMGVKGNRVNNWNPWILSNVMFCAAMVCEDEEEYRRLVLRAFELMENYVRSTEEQNFKCDEGVRYWNLSGACLFDAVEILYDLTGGKIDLTKSKIIQNTTDYITAMYSEYGLAANFADATIEFYPDCPLLVRAGERTDNALLRDMGRALYQTARLRSLHDNFYRQLKNLRTASRIQKPERFAFPPQKHLDGVDIFTMRKNGFFAVLKGGNNGENHNHNDVGSFVIYYKDTPLFIDPGVDLYSGFTFKATRDLLWYMNSDYHNLPVIAGRRQMRGGKYGASPMQTGDMTAQLNLSGAYGLEKAWLRKLDFSSEQVIVTDCFEFSPQEILLHYMLKERPEINGNEMRFSCGIKATIEGVEGLHLETLDLTGENPPDGIRGDTQNRIIPKYSALIPRLFVKQWGQTELYRITARPTGAKVMLTVTEA